LVTNPTIGGFFPLVGEGVLLLDVVISTKGCCREEGRGAPKEEDILCGQEKRGKIPSKRLWYGILDMTYNRLLVCPRI